MDKSPMNVVTSCFIYEKNAQFTICFYPWLWGNNVNQFISRYHYYSVTAKYSMNKRTIDQKVHWLRKYYFSKHIKIYLQMNR